VLVQLDESWAGGVTGEESVAGGDLGIEDLFPDRGGDASRRIVGVSRPLPVSWEKGAS
jgi:hypothetical protein